MKFYCGNCDNKKVLKGKKIRKKFDLCGLDYISVDGVTHYHCDKCGEDFFQYGDLEKLHRSIAEFVATREGSLTGKEIRFLRKYLGYNSETFARKYLLVEPETLSRYENDKVEHGDQIDQLIRTLALTKKPDRDYDVHDKLLERHKISDVEVINLKRYSFESAHP